MGQRVLTMIHDPSVLGGLQIPSFLEKLHYITFAQKPSLDKEEPSNYRPISNLSFYVQDH